MSSLVEDIYHHTRLSVAENMALLPGINPLSEGNEQSLCANKCGKQECKNCAENRSRMMSYICKCLGSMVAWDDHSLALFLNDLLPRMEQEIEITGIRKNAVEIISMTESKYNSRSWPRNDKTDESYFNVLKQLAYNVTVAECLSVFDITPHRASNYIRIRQTFIAQFPKLAIYVAAKKAVNKGVANEKVISALLYTSVSPYHFDINPWSTTKQFMENNW